MIGLEEDAVERVRGLEAFEEVFGSMFSFAGSTFWSLEIKPNEVVEVDVLVTDPFDENPDEQYIVRFMIPNGSVETEYGGGRFLEEVLVSMADDCDCVQVVFDGADVCISGDYLYLKVEEVNDDEDWDMNWFPMPPEQTN